MALPEILSTMRLRLRPFGIGDAGKVNELLGNPGIAAGALNIPVPYTIRDAEEWIEQHGFARERGEHYIFAVDVWSGDLVGAIGLRVNAEHRHGELGYWMGKSSQGKGYATEAVSAMLEFGFFGLDLHRIYARHLSWNLASGRVLQKSGMRYEGRMRGHAERWGSFHDIEVYGILREEFVDIFLGRKE